MHLVGRVLRVELLDPRGQGGQDGLRPALLEHEPGVVACPVFRRFEGVEQSFRFGADQLRARHQPPAPSVTNDWPKRSKWWPQALTQPRAKTPRSSVSGRNCQTPPPSSRRGPCGVSMWLWM